MALLDLPLDSIGEEHLESLKLNRVRENRVIEYKACIGNGSDDRKKFLAAISSFANSAGGDLVVGIRAEAGIAVELCGISDNVDAEKLRLENLARDGLQPRLPSLQMHSVQLSNGNAVLILRVRRSRTPYHRVLFDGHDKFYGRNNAGKYQLDVPELREAFTGAAVLEDRVRSFRAERILAIEDADTPVLLKAGPKTVIHVVSHAAFGEARIDGLQAAALAASGGNGSDSFLPRPWRGQLHFNFEGFVLSGRAIDDEREYPTNCYIQAYADGRIEAVENYMLGHGCIPAVFWESAIHEAVASFARLLGSMSAQPPLSVLVSLLGVQNFMLAPGRSVPEYNRVHAIDRTRLLLPDVIVDADTTDYWKVLRPIFDAVWRSANYPACPHYLSDGDRDPAVVSAASR